MARFTNGWVKFYRETVEGDIGEKPFLLGLFVKLLLWANWKEGSAQFKGERIKVQPGQLITGLRELSPDIELDPYLHRVRNALAYLEKRGTITQASSNQGRLITICNWSQYQVAGDDSSNLNAIQAQAERNPSANGAQLSEEGKKERKKKEEKGNVPLPRLAELWNENCGSLPIVRGCSSTRMKAVNARWSENSEEGYWLSIICTLAASPFCTGENDRQWKADFDFLLKPDTQHKALEGKYGAKLSGEKQSRPDLEAYELEMAELKRQAERQQSA